MDITLMISAVVALAAGAVIGWLATKAHADQIRAILSKNGVSWISNLAWPGSN
ncbi:DNA recombination protein RmuC [Salmonella enterica subsp. enterica]|uniref:DNA recombination protein RmuC n=1 Tax=Salmonella enterica I TaxID=59201 RepID=A0A379X4P4_SALET|nr:DNA recombination protein RmuC [Salmonella enterica subsp. enterica]